MRFFPFLFILSIIYVPLTYVTGLAVMSVDFGSEWIKVGIVSPGVPMEIALNKESKRKTPAIISFRDNVRLFGEDAQTIGLRFPKLAYGYLLDLLGKSVDNPLVKLYQERFPYYEILPNTDRDNTVLFKQDDNTTFTTEELIAQILQKAKEFAENAAHQPIKECVISVPGFFNQAERKAMLQAAEMADLKVSQLINDYTAVALNYGIFRAKTFNESSQYVLFYDMGASSTTATLVSYQTVKLKENSLVETHPQLTVLGVGYDRTLGGLEIQLRLRDYLAKKFNDMKKTSMDIFKNPRAMAKVFKEAGRLKNVLSANAEHYAQIEGLIDEQDYKLLVTRDELEGLINDLLVRIPKPVERALKTAHLTMDIVSQVVIVGGGTRMPKIQETLQKSIGKDLSKNLNADEAVAMGAAYKAADLSTGFKVTKFITKDAVLFPIQIVFQRQTADGIKTVKRMLFSLMNPYPQRKIITFNKHTDDFDFYANYAELDYLNEPNEISNIGSHNLTKYQVTDVAYQLESNSDENTESKGIKVHFNIDESGVLNIASAELVLEKTVPVEDEGTLSRLGSTFSKFFSGDEKTPLDTTEQGIDEKPVHEINEDETATTTTTTVPTTTIPEDTQVPTEKQEEIPLKSTVNSTDKELKSKIITIKKQLVAMPTFLSIRPLDVNEIDGSLEKIKRFDKIEKDLNKRATALNNLESFIIDVQNKLDEDEFIRAATVEEVENIRQVCSALSEWLYDEGTDASAKIYEGKLAELRELTKDLFAKVWEHKERPEALQALDSMLNHSTTFIKTARNLTEAFNPEKAVFRDGEIDALEKIVNETIEWKNKTVNEQNALKHSESPKLTIKQIMDKIAALDREVKYLLTKLRYFKPKKVENSESKQQQEKPSNGNDEEKKLDDNKKNEEENILKIAPGKKLKSTIENDQKKNTNKDGGSDKDGQGEGLHQEL